MSAKEGRIGMWSRSCLLATITVFALGNGTLALADPPAMARAPVITEFPSGPSFSSPDGLTEGPDGNLWFTSSIGRTLGRISPDGQVTGYAVPVPNGGPHDIASGPGGFIWYIGADGTVDSIDPPTGQVQTYSLGGVAATSMAGGPD